MGCESVLPRDAWSQLFDLTRILPSGRRGEQGQRSDSCLAETVGRAALMIAAGAVVVALVFIQLRPSNIDPSRVPGCSGTQARTFFV